ncbi:ABC transporter permease [Pseudooceanicola sp. CBS1P-1]|uniref:ABC transporter permease subunit n=1 Tax=Pseudooceanicola albus TaxID=2692189 RepID=A0A6L7G614_9RHOB|nr:MULTISPECIES: ABC transporter permease [Pseudooceanicola]MBT9386091.1 ABC transporter permease [Pseudooceanicola endophyticus]MXN19491.1 ABC transporter permease subunit [Pseudooceanicola albus]
MRAALFLIGPVLLFLGLSYLLPFLGIVELSFTDPQPGLAQYQKVLTDPLTLSVIARTLRLCILVTLVSVTAAYVITLLWVRGSPLVRSLTELCIMIPFWLSILSRAFGWLAMLSNRGLLNSWMKHLGLIDSSLQMTRNEFAVVVGMAHYLIPFAIFPLATAMRNVDERVLTAADGMGASRGRIFWQVFLPMTRSGILGATLLVFVFSIGFYVTPALLGGGQSVLIAELIYLWIFQIPQWGMAAAMSVVLMLAVGGILYVLMRRYGEMAK